MTEYRGFDDLSVAQRTAASHVSGPGLTLATAGAGKTKMLVGRLRYLMTPRELGGVGAHPSSIAVMTFTNKAAREMISRVDPVLDDLKARGVHGKPWIGTFHNICLRILRIEAKSADLAQNFTILDESDTRSMVAEIIKERGIENFDLDEFFDGVEFLKARVIRPEVLSDKISEISEWRADHGKDENVWPAAEDDPFLAPWGDIVRRVQECGPAFAEIYAAYQDELREQNSVDFSDIINKTVLLFRDNPVIKAAWQAKFRHFLMDEWQDANPGQLELVREMTGRGEPFAAPEGAVFSDVSDAATGMRQICRPRVEQFPRASISFVGDDDQSIYGFRGSDVGIMRSVRKHFPGTEVMRLEESYRCQPDILSVAERLISGNDDRMEKRIRPARPDSHRRAVQARDYEDWRAEIRDVVAEASRFVAAGGDPSEFMILARTRDAAKAFAKELRGAGVPVVEGKSSDLRKTEEVRDAMALAGYVVNASAETLMRRIINKPSRGMGAKSISVAMANARLRKVSLFEEIVNASRFHQDMLDGDGRAPEECDGFAKYPKRFSESCRDFLRITNDMRRAASSAGNAGEAIGRLLTISGLLGKLKEEAIMASEVRHDDPRLLALADLGPREFLIALMRMNGDRHDDIETVDAEELSDRAGRVSESFRRLGNLALLIEQARPVATLGAFVQESTLEMSQEVASAGVRVMTIHASKGLEADHVRVVSFIEGMIPHSNSVTPEQICEERRLAFVAFTRARETLQISGARSMRGSPWFRGDFARRSPFLKELELADTKDFAIYGEDGRRRGVSRGGPFVCENLIGPSWRPAVRFTPQDPRPPVSLDDDVPEMPDDLPPFAPVPGDPGPDMRDAGPDDGWEPDYDPGPSGDWEPDYQQA